LPSNELFNSVTSVFAQGFRVPRRDLLLMDFFSTALLSRNSRIMHCMDVNQAWIVFNFEEDKMHRKEWLWAANHLDAEFHIVAPISALRPDC